MKDILYIISGSPDVNLNFIKTLNLKNKRIYAVDSGFKICDKLNILPEKIIGDFDSSSLKKVKSLYEEKKIHKYPIKKDKSDTELAVELAVKRKFKEIVLLNATGGRIDHLFFNAFLLLRYPQKVFIENEQSKISALKPGKEYNLKIKQGTYFSLIPLSNIKHLSIKNAEYELAKKDIKMNSLTLSNKVSSNTLSIGFKKGKLLLYILKGDKHGKSI